ncbi:MAG: Trm112 family protein [Thermomicrobiales bacterium]
MTETTTTQSGTSDAQRLGISEELLAILVCPIDHSRLAIDGDALICSECGRRYPVQNGIPNMVVD